MDTEAEILKRELEEARAEVDRLRKQLADEKLESASWRATARDKGASARSVAAERDEARAEIARLKAEEKQGVQDYLDLRDVADRAIVERERAKIERVELLLRVETLRELADRAAHEQGVAQRRMIEAQEAREALRKDLVEWKTVAEEIVGMFDPVVTSGSQVDWPHLKKVCVGAKRANESLREVKDRARRACQILIEEIGADGPTDVDEVADRAAVLIRELRDQVKDLQTAAEESEHAMHLRIRTGYDKTIADCWRAKVAEVERERDEARNELVLMRSLGPKAHDLARQRDENAELAESLRVERDTARAEVEALKAEVERIHRLLDHATQSNPGTSVLVMLMNESREARAETERLRAERDAFYAGQKGSLAEFDRREVHQRAYNEAFDREIERGKTPAEAADIAGRVAYWDVKEAAAKVEP